MEEYFNGKDESTLVLVKEDYSEMYVENHFRKSMPYLEALPRYSMHLVKSFTVNSSMGNRIKYEFDYSKPNDAFYALRIIKGEFYILFNPSTRKTYQWGKPGEFYVIGMEYMFTIAYCDNILLRDTIVLTNSAEGLLFLQDKGIPCVALLNGEIELPDYFEQVISPLFPNRYLLLDMAPNRNEQQRAFTTYPFGQVHLA